MHKYTFIKGSMVDIKKKDALDKNGAVSPGKERMLKKT